MENKIWNAVEGFDPNDSLICYALPKTTNKLILGFSERGKPMAIMSYDDPDCLCLIAAVRFRDC